MVRRILAFLAAIASMVCLGSIAHSLFVQHAWMSAARQSGIAAARLTLGERLQWVVHDLIGLQPTYAALTAVALLIGLLIAGWIARSIQQRLAIFAVAGAAAIFTLFSVLKLALGTVGVFGARGAAGLATQMLAGLIAAALFAVLERSKPRPHSHDGERQ